jgi:uncharacterized protein (DUF433 family)
MTTPITIVDEGRGPQLSTSRVTVQDLVPYLDPGYTPQHIQEVMPTLSLEEIQVVTNYIAEHRDAVADEDRLIRERNLSRGNSPKVEAILKQARVERRARMELHQVQGRLSACYSAR